MMLKLSSAVIWRLGMARTLRSYTTSSATIPKAEKVDVQITDKSVKNLADNDKNTPKASGLVAAAFASLNNPEEEIEQKKPSPKSAKIPKLLQIDMQISNATTIDSLLVVAENSVVSRRHALKVVSVLSEWSMANKVKLSDFEKDPRFLKLCRILARSQTAQAVASLHQADDLSTVLGITGDDEAARLISNLTMPQMIKVMSSLAKKGRRSMSLLRALAHNITRQPETLSLKRSADLLFSMAALNFPDEMLMDRICNDILESLQKNVDNYFIVTRITVSLGILKYRHENVLSALSQWITSRGDKAQPTDVASTVVTMATLHYTQQDLDTLIKAALTIREEDLIKPSNWLDLVFALLILDRSTPKHLESVLSADFIYKLYGADEIPIPVRRKLITIEAFSLLTNPEYAGPRLSEEVAHNVPIIYTKEKQLYVQSIMETLKNLVSSENFIKRNCNSGMGFLYDAEFVLDSKCHPVPLEKASDDRNFRIAIMGLGYHDMCRKTPEPLGVIQLYKKLLELKGYKVLQIPYTEFNPHDKLITRVKYIEKRLKDIVTNNT